jgi:hypothetical protein
MTVVVRQLLAACFASCTDGSETYQTEKGSAKCLRERFGTVNPKATNSQGARFMNEKAPIFSDLRCQEVEEVATI